MGPFQLKNETKHRIQKDGNCEHPPSLPCLGLHSHVLVGEEESFSFQAGRDYLARCRDDHGTPVLPQTAIHQSSENPQRHANPTSAASRDPWGHTPRQQPHRPLHPLLHSCRTGRNRASSPVRSPSPGLATPPWANGSATRPAVDGERSVVDPRDGTRICLPSPFVLATPNRRNLLRRTTRVRHPDAAHGRDARGRHIYFW
jgi:hypothetical protein